VIRTALVFATRSREFATSSQLSRVKEKELAGVIHPLSKSFGPATWNIIGIHNDHRDTGHAISMPSNDRPTVVMYEQHVIYI
jgi:hypothetical protein